MTLDIPYLSLITLPGSICGLSNPLPPFMYHKNPALLRYHFVQQCGQVTLLSISFNNWFQGITEGFCIGFDYDSTITLKSAKSNMLSAHFHFEAIDEYLKTEISLDWVAGPFPLEPILDAHVKGFGIIPKKWWLFVDLFFPTGYSVNDGISPPLCFVHYRWYCSPDIQTG